MPKLNIKEELGMKKLEIIIKPEKLEDLKGVLDTEEVNGFEYRQQHELW